MKSCRLGLNLEADLLYFLVHQFAIQDPACGAESLPAQTTRHLPGTRN
jgi:hypothetical protein